MPKEQRKRGRREEKKRKREEEAAESVALPIKRQKSEETDDEVKFIEDGDEAEAAAHQEDYTPQNGVGDLPFYGLLDEDEQEYFKRADSMLEVNQFANTEERDLFLANVYQEANGKELKIVNSQSCSRLMERLILLSTPNQLKALFQKLSGHFLHLVQHRFASHCCEALFLQAAPIVTQEQTAPNDGKLHIEGSDEVYVSMENLFLYTLNELEGNLGYLMTDQFASHPLRVLLIILSGMPLSAASTSSLLQSKKKEHVSIATHAAPALAENTKPRAVPDSFHDAVGTMISGTLAKLDTTYLQALACQPVANPVLQLLLELELTRSGKQSAKDPSSFFRKLLPDEPPEEGTESATFINHLLYDTVGSRLLEVIVTHSPGKTFKTLFRSTFQDKLGTLAKNEIAAFVVAKILERLNKEDLESAVAQICPHIAVLIERSRTSIMKTMIERCRIRQVDTQSISDAVKEGYGNDSADRLSKILKVSMDSTGGMSEDRKGQIEYQDSSKVHGSLLAQSMLDAPGPLRDFITDGLLATETPVLLSMVKDRTASRVLQTALLCPEQSPKVRRLLIPRFYGHIAGLAIHTVASHVIDAFWDASTGLAFIRERIAEELVQDESALRDSIAGRAVWRNWKMDMYKTRRREWSNLAKGVDGVAKKTAIELARERHAVLSTTSRQSKMSGKNHSTGANAAVKGKA